MPEKLGIEELKDVVALGISVGELVEALSDGVGISDIGKLVAVVRRAPAAVASLKSGKVLPELKDLDAEEKMALKAWAAEELDLENDKVEAAVEAGLNVAIDLCDLLKIGVA